MEQELLNKVKDTADRAREAEDKGMSMRTQNKRWNAHFKAVDALKAYQGRA